MKTAPWDPGPDLEPPTCYEAEQALLGAVLADNAAMGLVSSFLQSEHFADPGHGRIYLACANLIERGKTANAVTLKQMFDADDDLSDVGGAKYLAELQGNFVSITGAKDYAEVILDSYLRRQTIEVCRDALLTAHEDFNTPAKGILETMAAEIDGLSEDQTIGSGLQPVSVAVDDAMMLAEQALAGGRAGVPTGLQNLDKLLGGLHRSELTILAGRPGMGKTGLATNIATVVARLIGPVAFFSLEMPKRQLAARMVAEIAGVSATRISRGQISIDTMTELVVPAGSNIRRLPLFIDDGAALTIPAIRSGARRLKRKHGLALVVVDYLQICGVPRNQRRNRVDDVTELSAGLKALAKDLDIPVLALSQLSRKVEERDDKRPMLSDLRDSGSIEQDADVVIFLYREAYYKSRQEPRRKVGESEEKFNVRYGAWKADLDAIMDKAELIVPKQRNGPTGDVTLRFDETLTTFSDWHG